MKLPAFVVAASLLTAPAASSDAYSQYCDTFSGATELDAGPLRVAGVDYLIDVNAPEACFVFTGIGSTVSPSHLCVGLADDEDEPVVLATFPDGSTEDVSDAYLPSALRPWATSLYKQYVASIGPPV